MDALGRTQRSDRHRSLVERTDLVRPDAGRVHHHFSLHVEADAAAEVESRPADAAVVLLEQPGDRCVVGSRGAVVEHRGAGHRQRQAGVVGAGVPVEEAGDEPVGAQRREVALRLVQRQTLVALADPDATGRVVEPQRGRVGLGHRLVDGAVLSEQRDEEWQGLDKVGCVVEQSLPLGQRLVDEPVLLLLQIPQAAVHQLRRPGRRARREVPGLDQAGAQATRRRVQRDADSGDAAADHEDVERFVGQPRQGGVPVERRARADRHLFSSAYDVRNPSVRSVRMFRSRTTRPAASTK